MAKLSTVNREKKRELLVNKYFEKMNGQVPGLKKASW